MKMERLFGVMFSTLARQVGGPGSITKNGLIIIVFISYCKPS